MLHMLYGLCLCKCQNWAVILNNLLERGEKVFISLENNHPHRLFVNKVLRKDVQFSKGRPDKFIGVCTDTYVFYQSVLEKKTYES